MKRGIAVILMLVIPPAIYSLTMGDRHEEELRRLNDELKELDTRVLQAQAAQRKLSQFHEELARLDQELTKLRVILPPGIALDEVAAAAEERAALNGAHLTRFQAVALDDRHPLQRQSIRAEVVGSAEGTAGFLRGLQNAARIIDVSSVTLRKDPLGWRTGFIATVYALPDGSDLVTGGKGRSHGG